MQMHWRDMVSSSDHKLTSIEKGKIFSLQKTTKKKKKKKKTTKKNKKLLNLFGPGVHFVSYLIG